MRLLAELLESKASMPQDIDGFVTNWMLPKSRGLPRVTFIPQLRDNVLAAELILMSYIWTSCGFPSTLADNEDMLTLYDIVTELRTRDIGIQRIKRGFCIYCNAHGHAYSHDEVDELISTNWALIKKMVSLATKIRANEVK